MLANAEQSLPTWRAEHARLLEAQDRAYAAYLVALHRETGGELPRGPGGQLIVAIDVSGDHPETMAARPAQPQWQAYKRAGQRPTRRARPYARWRPPSATCSTTSSSASRPEGAAGAESLYRL